DPADEPQHDDQDDHSQNGSELLHGELQRFCTRYGTTTWRRSVTSRTFLARRQSHSRPVARFGKPKLCRVSSFVQACSRTTRDGPISIAGEGEVSRGVRCLCRFASPVMQQVSLRCYVSS